MRLLPVILACGLAFPALSAPASADSGTPSPPADPALRAEIETLVRNLGHPELERREEAGRRLAGIGPEAAWALVSASESGEPEVRLRARELLDGMAWIRADQREEIDRLIGVLETTRDRQAASRAFDLLNGMGKGARKRLEALFPDGVADPGALELSVRLETTTLTREKPSGFRVVFRNGGKAPLWIDPDALQYFPKWEDDPADAARDAEVMGAVVKGQIMKEALVAAGGRGPGAPTFRSLCLAPGETLEQDVSLPGNASTRVGPFRLAVRYDTTAAQDRLPDADPGDGFTPPVQRLLAEAETGPAWMLPSLDRKESGLKMELVPAERETASGTPLVFDLVLTGENNRPGIRLDLPPGRAPGLCFWAALLAEDGTVAAMKAYRHDAGSGTARILGKKGEPVRLTAELPQDVPPGRYRLVAGYSGARLESGFARLFGGKIGGGTETGKAWTGESVAPPVPVTIR